MSLQYRQVAFGTSNCAVLLREPESGTVCVVDPGEAAPVLRAAEEDDWLISMILVTHHHSDHVGGCQEIREQTGATVYGPARNGSRIPCLDVPLTAGSHVHVGGAAAVSIATPGHTLDHLAYWFAGEGLLFSGDCLFSLGCGRIFEGSPRRMWESLCELAALPDDTMVFCGHDLTADNLEFALALEPDRPDLLERAAEVDRALARGESTLPFSLGLNRRANPFLRAADPQLAARLGMRGASDVAVFAELRARKDRFRPGTRAAGQ